MIDIPQHKAGSELNRAVHEKVLKLILAEECNGELNEFYDGWRCQCGAMGEWAQTGHSEHCPDYSTDMRAVWRVISHTTDPHLPRVEGFPPGTRLCYWWEKANLWAYAEAEAATAICNAVLWALGVD